MADWDHLLKELNCYHCQCGSGGPMACDDDCPGDVGRDDPARELLRALVTELLERHVIEDWQASQEAKP